MEDMIRVRGLAKHYEGFALENIGFSVPPGTVVGLIGSNGAGKTTILKSMLGITTPDAGCVELLGSRVEDEKTIDTIKARIGVVLDTCAFPDVNSVSDAGALGNAAYATWDAGRFTELCAEFGLDRRKKIKDLSRGMGMKLSLAFALSHNPELLILDEATAGLDPMARDEVLDILRRFMEEDGHAILLSTHITSDLEKIADEIICIEEGRLVFDLPKESVCDEAGIARCRVADLERLARDDTQGNALHVLHREMSTDVLVPDRFAFARAFPDIPVERASIEDYMTLTLRGIPLDEALRARDSSMEVQR